MFFNIAASGVAEGALGPTKGDGTTGCVTTGVAPLVCHELLKKRAQIGEIGVHSVQGGL